MVIRRAPGRPQCGVCTDKGARCSPTDVSLSKAQAAELEFGCPEPQEVFNVRLQRMIGKGTYLHLHVGAKSELQRLALA
jgi:hypothetical protein